MELVAPAGDMDSFRLAVANGADAVYLGAKSFSARQYASNFDLAELESIIRLAHLHRTRIYLTLNTLLRTDEMEEALSLARSLYEAGVDAVIVQDLGLLLQIRRDLPELRVHASTQMTVVNTPTMRALGRLGVVRAVLAREATEAEIKSMAEAGPEVEVFIHGALCYSYSGQCLMSSIIGGRSGNRGRCAQPCRMAYSLEGSGAGQLAIQGRYLLSTRDLCQLPNLPRLMAAGVHALKIEGRMKRPEYVGTVVRVYRQALDRLAGDPGDYAPDPEGMRELEQIFNRGFTPGFFSGDQGRAYQSLKRPNNRGFPVGRVAAVERDQGRALIALTEDVRLGDGVEIWVTKGGRVGGSIEDMRKDGRPVESGAAGDVVSIPLLPGVRPGDRIFRTSDKALQDRAREPLISGAGWLLPFDARFQLELGKPARLELDDEDGNRTAVTGEVPGQAARNRPLSAEVVGAHLGRTGGTVWMPARIEVGPVEGIMLPLSELNEIRRRGLASLEEARLSAFPASPKPPAAGVPPAEPCASIDASRGISATVGDSAEAGAALAAGVNRLYLASWMHAWTDGELAELRAKAVEKGASLVYALPGVAPQSQMGMWEAEMERLGRLGLDGLRLSDLGLAGPAGRIWGGRLYFDYRLNVMNRWSLGFLAGQAARVTLSPELTLAQARDLAAACPGRSEILAHGRLEMMISAHCMLGSVLGGKEGPGSTCDRPCLRGSYALRDRLGVAFPLVPDRFCRLHVQNSRDLSTLAELSKVARGAYDLRLELQGRGPDYAGAVVGAYRRGLDAVAAGSWTREAGVEEERSLLPFSPEGFTRGHFFRGVE